MKLMFKWYIGDNQSDEYPYEVADADKDDNKQFEIYLQKDLGVKPIRVQAGEKIHLCTKSQNSDYS